jgi:microcystin degradation protein MlrC
VRVAVGGFWHETNTFNPLPTTRACFEAPPGRTWRGDAMTAAFDGEQPVLTGFAEGLRLEDIAAVPTFFAMAGPYTGTITDEAFEWVATTLVDMIREADADGLLLHVHGAAVSERHLDPESELLRRLRVVVGPNRPIITVNDAHGNVGSAWIEAADVAMAYRMIPHLDMIERGVDAARTLARVLRREIKPVAAIRRPPILLKGGLMSMTEAPTQLLKPPMYWLSRRAREIERDPRIIDVSINAGFADADVPEAGLSIIVHADGDDDLAAGHADALAELAWTLRHGFDPSLVMTPTPDAVGQAMATDEWPVVLADEGCNTAGGSPGDGTAILFELRNRAWPDAALFIHDPDALDMCLASGLGSDIEVDLGGRLDPSSGSPCRVAGRIGLLGSGHAFLGETMSDPGRVAVLRCGQTDIVVSEHPTSQTSPAHFRRFGIEPRYKRIVVVQSAAVFRHGFEVAERVARTIVEVDTPGITNPDPRRFSYHHIQRPVYPLD